MLKDFPINQISMEMNKKSEKASSHFRNLKKLTENDRK